MAIDLLNEWGIQKCEDWGEIVFTMVEYSLLKTSEKDSRDDFKGGYDFFEAFRQPFLPARPAPPERLREAHSQA